MALPETTQPYRLAGIQQTFGGYAASELTLCPTDPDGVIWHNEGLQIGKLPANH